MEGILSVRSKVIIFELQGQNEIKNDLKGITKKSLKTRFSLRNRIPSRPLGTEPKDQMIRAIEI